MKNEQTKENSEHIQEKAEDRMMSMLLEAEQGGKVSIFQRLFGGDGFGMMIMLVVLALLAAGAVLVLRVYAPSVLGDPAQHTEAKAETPPPAQAAEPVKAVEAPPTEMQAIVVEESKEQKEKKIVAALESWAAAWSAKDLNKYFAAYAASFEPPKGQQRQAWESDRKARISGKSAIKVQIKDVSVKLEDKKAVVTLTQQYQADEINAVGKKVFDLVQEGDQWLILREANQ